MEIRNGKYYALLFMFFLCFLALGGFLLTKALTKHEPKSESEVALQKKEESNLKLDETKDYIYLYNTEEKSSEHGVIFTDIKINLKGEEASNLTTKLNQEMNDFRLSFQKISAQELSAEQKEQIIYEQDDIYSTNYRKYTRYFNENYVSLLLDDYTFHCIDGIKYLKSSSYVFDLKTAKLLTNQDLLNIYDLSLEKIKGQVKNHLLKSQDEEEALDITTTLNNLDNENNYALYINKSGFLTISYLVKSAKVDYNDVIILN